MTWARKKLPLLKIVTLFSIGYINVANAADAVAKSLGEMANNIFEPLMIATDLLYLTCFIVGLGFVAASIIKIFERRSNPLGVRISQIVFLFCAGFFMLVMPYFLINTEEGVTGGHYATIFNS